MTFLTYIIDGLKKTCIARCRPSVKILVPEAGISSKDTLQWHHNGPDGVSNHQPHDCLFNRLLRRRSRKTPKLRVTDLCAGNSPVTGNSPHKRPVTRKMFPFDDVIICILPQSAGCKHLYQLYTHGFFSDFSFGLIEQFSVNLSWWLSHILRGCSAKINTVLVLNQSC